MDARIENPETIRQLSDGRAQCTRVALCDETGLPVTQLSQGDSAHFFFDFLVLADLEAVSGGVEICDESGRVVHGKDSYQREADGPIRGVAGTILQFHVVVELNIACGEYRFTVGLASVDADLLSGYRDGTQTYLQLSKAASEHVRASDAGRFSVLPRADGRLSHHGMADLPGWQEVVTLPAQAIAVPQGPVGVSPVNTQPTIFHVTHWKAGSQWIKQILLACAPERIVAPQIGETQYRHWPIQGGKIYPTIYIDKKDFDARRQPAPFRRFVVIRDLRDTLVSGYFSMKISHAEIDRAVSRFRGALNSLSLDDGMIYLMDEWLAESARIQLTWQEAGERLLKYEDLIEHDLEILEPLLLDECGLAVARERFRQIVISNRFENQALGRRPGTEDLTSHNRKGISGDWKTHFTEKVKRAFKARFGGILVATGYERDLNW